VHSERIFPVPAFERFEWFSFDDYQRRQINPIRSKPAILSNYALCFNLFGAPLLEPLFANIRPQASSEVHGVMYELSHEDWIRLKNFEGRAEEAEQEDPENHEGGYICTRFPVITYDGEHHECFAFICPDSAASVVSPSSFIARCCRLSLYPSTRYLNLLREGSKEHDLNPNYIKALIDQPSLTTRMFLPRLLLALLLTISTVILTLPFAILCWIVALKIWCSSYFSSQHHKSMYTIFFRKYRSILLCGWYFFALCEYFVWIILQCVCSSSYLRQFTIHPVRDSLQMNFPSSISKK